MSIERADVEKIAKLARIEITEQQVQRVTQDLSNILDLVDQLQSVDTSGVKPMAHPMDAVQKLRPDAVTETDQRAAFQQIAPATEDGLYLVPKVID